MSHAYGPWSERLRAFVCEKCVRLLTAEELLAAKNLLGGHVISTPCEGDDE